MQEPWKTKIAELTNSYEYISVNVGSSQITPFIEKVQEEDNSSILIVGDSVCAQTFSGLQEYNDEICIAGTNAAITVAGQYILIEEYISNHPDATDIYLVLLPESMCRTFDTEWGYQYAVMPFVRTDTLCLLDEDTIEIMESVYGKVFMDSRLVKLIDKSAVNRKLYLNMLEDHSEGYVQENPFELAEQYIGKIYELCNTRNINLHLVPGPVSEINIEKNDELRSEYEQTSLYYYFPNYFDEVYYYPAEQAIDGVHFSGEYATQEIYNEKIQVLIKDTNLERILKYE